MLAVTVPSHHHFFHSNAIHGSYFEKTLFISCDNMSIWLNILMKLNLKQSCHIHWCETLWKPWKITTDLQKKKIKSGKHRICDNGNLLLAYFSLKMGAVLLVSGGAQFEIVIIPEHSVGVLPQLVFLHLTLAEWSGLWKC